jgi:hypothetical protein
LHRNPNLSTHGGVRALPGKNCLLYGFGLVNRDVNDALKSQSVRHGNMHGSIRKQKRRR